jgi:dihydroflavonol-4-reductase
VERSVMGDGTVLVTGGSGYIGGWCVARLLNDGWQVRTTIRNLARESDVRRALATVAPQQDALSFAVADLDRDEGWAEAAKGCRYVLHVASPLGLEAPRDPEVLIRPAREGARRVIHAAIAAGAERLVMTSSVSAVNEAGVESVADETHWTDPAAKGVSAYAQSKTLAERAAWKLIGESGGATTLSTILPTLVVGPVMSGDFSGSVLAISRLLKGAPGVPNLGFNYVDVRDVADLHLRAMLSPAAAGQRFIASSEFLWYGEVAALLRERLGDRGSKVPTWPLPDIVVRGVAVIDRQLSIIVGNLSRRRDFSSAKAAKLLNWRARPAREAILDCARSLIEHKLV